MFSYQRLFKNSLLVCIFGLVVCGDLTCAPPASPPPQKGATGEKKQETKLYKPPVLPTMNVSTIFTSPGIATLEADGWVGSEHLYNLPTELGVVVEVVKPVSIPLTPVAGEQSPAQTTDKIPLVATGPTLPIAEDKIKELISKALKTVQMSVRDPLIDKGTPLPFLHILIIVHPIEKGYVAYCAGRLFEAVQLNRIYLKTNIVFQAITWEKQELVISPAEQLRQQVEETVQSIIDSFVERIKNYAFEKNKDR